MDQLLTPHVKATIELISIVIGSAGAIVYFISKTITGIKDKKSEEQSDAFKALQYKEALNVEQAAEIKRLNLVVEQDAKDKASTQSLLTSEKEKNATMVQLLANRDPGFETFMKSTIETHTQILVATKDIIVFTKEILKSNGEILKAINEKIPNK